MNSKIEKSFHFFLSLFPLLTCSFIAANLIKLRHRHHHHHRRRLLLQIPSLLTKWLLGFAFVACLKLIKEPREQQEEENKLVASSKLVFVAVVKPGTEAAHKWTERKIITPAILFHYYYYYFYFKGEKEKLQVEAGVSKTPTKFSKCPTFFFVLLQCLFIILFLIFFPSPSVYFNLMS